MTSDHNVAQQLHPELAERLQRVRARRNFVARDWIDQKLDLFNNYMRKNGLKACVVSVSGGIDSACTLALMKAAQRRNGSPIERVVGIAQPIKSTEKIWKRAYEVGDALGAEMIMVDQTELHTQLQDKCDQALGITGQSFATGQLKSYMRTPVNYYVSQLISQNGQPCIVLGTGNYDEDGYLLYFCKAGDGIADVQLINDLHKSEVFAVSRELGVPESVLAAPPSADLWEGQTDENELGFTYDFVELLTEWMQYSEQDKVDLLHGLSADALAEWESTKKKAETIHRRMSHKLEYPVNLNILASPPLH